MMNNFAKYYLNFCINCRAIASREIGVNGRTAGQTQETYCSQPFVGEPRRHNGNKIELIT